MAVNDFEIESKTKNFSFKIQSSDLSSVKNKEYKGPVIRLSFEYKKELHKINPNELKLALNEMKKVISSSGIDAKEDILKVLNQSISLIDKNKGLLIKLDSLKKSFSVNPSIELITDTSDIFINLSGESELSKVMDKVKSGIKSLPILIWDLDRV